MKSFYSFSRPLVIAVGMTLLLFIIFFTYETMRLKDQTLQQARSHIKDHEKILAEKLRSVTKDLRYLAQSQLLLQYIESPNARNIRQLQAEFVHFAVSKGIYDQVRLIDPDGHEIIRVNYNRDDDTARTVPHNRLQNKHDRYYFRESIGLKKGEIYLSKLDLNIENGVIEAPRKPMLRFATPLTDGTGAKRGILILNYLADDMLDPLNDPLEQKIGCCSLLNDEGYWLVAPDTEDTWGFMYESGKERTFALRHPQVWHRINAVSEAIHSEGDFIAFHSTFYPISTIQEEFSRSNPSPELKRLFHSPDNRWFLIYQVEPKEIRMMMIGTLKDEWYLHSLVFILLTVTAYMALLFFQKRHEHLQSLTIISEVYRSTRDGILITDADANIMHVNRAFTEITGYAESEVEGKNPRLVASGWTDEAVYTTMWETLLAKGYWEGELRDRRKNGSIYIAWLRITAVKNPRGRTTNYVSVFSDITEQVEARKKTQELAYYDSLTKLPNRNLFFDRLHHTLDVSGKKGRRCALMLVDLDNFKNVNDTLGHLAGDKLLIGAAEKISRCIGETNTVSRFGGDEFIVLMEDVTEIGELAATARCIVDEVSSPQQIMGAEARVGASVGIALYPDDTTEQNQLLQFADSAMYRVKETGKSSYCFYSDDQKG